MDSGSPVAVDTGAVCFLFKDHQLAQAHQAILATQRTASIPKRVIVDDPNGSSKLTGFCPSAEREG
jgi:hypothetical protein